MQSIGILGGSFNPPHIGHVSIARSALEALSLDQVMLIPAAQPPHKLLESDPGPDLRFEMCMRTAAEVEGVTASRVELDRPGPSYTVDTLEALHNAEPDAELTLLLGADMVLDLPSWREPGRVVELARIAWAARDGVDRAQVEAVVSALGGERPPQTLPMDQVDVSSTEIRKLIGRGEPIDGLVPEGVGDLIREQGIYLGGSLVGEGGA